jgi:outer membrane receptor protein involved in Fe transport
VRDASIELGVDLTSWAHLEFGYMRLDQTGVEFPGQVFDTKFLSTDAWRARLTLDQQDWFDNFYVVGWYNTTDLKGDNQGADKRRQIPTLDALNFVGFTDIGQSSAGYRTAMTWGKAKDPQLTVGTDMRWMTMTLNEFDSFFGLAIPCGNTFNFPIPHSDQYVVGTFFEYIQPFADKLTLKFGGRGDYVYMRADHNAPGFADCEAFDAFISQPDNLGTTDLTHEQSLWMAYGTAEYKPSEHWTFTAAAGHAERPPTLTELYATGPFLAILQQGFTSIIGDPTLAPERLWQGELGFEMRYDRFRAGADAYYSWIQDYITYEAIGPAKQNGLFLPGNLENALTVRFVNTNLATIYGFEAYGETDLTCWLTPFVTTSYVNGTDDTRNNRGIIPGAPEEPLPGIVPWETKAGLRFHEGSESPRYGVEIFARYDARQNRVAASLLEQPSAGFVVWNLRSYWQVRKGLLLTAGVENIFDRNYREHLDLLTGIGVYQPGTNGYFGVELKY